MNKTIQILLMTACLFAFCACSNDIENPYAKTSSITILSQDLIFGVKADKGTVKVSAPNGITKVTLSQDWCSASFSGEEVVVEVPDNHSLEERYSKLTIWSGEDSTSLEIFQAGLVFEIKDVHNIMQNSYDAKSYEFNVNTNTDIDIKTSDSWITALLADKKLKINVAKNTAGVSRVGYIYYGIPGREKDTLQIVQFDYEKDVKGTYRFTYFDTKRKQWVYLLANLNEKAIQFINRDWSIPIMTDMTNSHITFTSGARIGEFDYKGTLYIYLLFGDPSGKYWSAQLTNVKLQAQLVADVKPDGKINFRYIFDGKKFTVFDNTYDFGGFYFEAFRKDELSESTLTDKDVNIGFIIYAEKPYLEKTNNQASSKAIPLSETMIKAR